MKAGVNMKVLVEMVHLLEPGARTQSTVKALFSRQLAYLVLGELTEILEKGWG